MPAPESPLVAQVAAPETSISVAPDDVPLVFDPDQQQPAPDAQAAAHSTQGEQPQPEADAVTQPPPSTDLRQTATQKLSQVLAAVRPGEASSENRQPESNQGPAKVASARQNGLKSLLPGWLP